jgi:5'(3')-deoxyribonucleotidase
MKITLDIDPTVLGTEVSEFIKTLTPEDKNALVKQVVAEYYSDYRKFEEGERQIKDKEWLEKARREMSSYDKPRYVTDEQVRGHYEYQNAQKDYKTFSQTTRLEISAEIRKQLTAQIGTFIKDDPEYQQLLKDSMQVVRETFPMLVQAAMIEHMKNELPSAINYLDTGMGNLNNRLNQIEQKLLR